MNASSFKHYILKIVHTNTSVSYFKHKTFFPTMQKVNRNSVLFFSVGLKLRSRSIWSYRRTTEDVAVECRRTCVCPRLIRTRAFSLPVTHTDTTHTTHAHTHHVGFYGLRGLSIGVMVFYCTNCMCYCPTPTLHLNLALTGDGAFLLSPQKLTLYDL